MGFGGRGQATVAGSGKVALQGHHRRCEAGPGASAGGEGRLLQWGLPDEWEGGRAQTGRNYRSSLESERKGHGAAAAGSGGQGVRWPVGSASGWGQGAARDWVVQPGKWWGGGQGGEARTLEGCPSGGAMRGLW